MYYFDKSRSAKVVSLLLVSSRQRVSIDADEIFGTVVEFLLRGTEGQ